jgi:hypothetical protein
MNRLLSTFLHQLTLGRKLVVAMSVCSATAFIAIVMATILRFILVRLNEKLDRGEHVEGAINSGMGVPGEAAERGFRFLT